MEEMKYQYLELNTRVNHILERPNLPKIANTVIRPIPIRFKISDIPKYNENSKSKE